VTSDGQWSGRELYKIVQGGVNVAIAASLEAHGGHGFVQRGLTDSSAQDDVNIAGDIAALAVDVCACASREHTMNAVLPQCGANGNCDQLQAGSPRQGHKGLPLRRGRLRSAA